MLQYEMSSGADDVAGRQMAMLDELRRSERQVAISYVAAMITHSVGTPLNVIVGRAGMIRRDPNAAEVMVGNAKSIEQKVEQLATKLRSLVEFLSPPESESNFCDIDALFDDTVSLYEPIARTRNVTLSTSIEPNLVGGVDRSLAFVVLSCLVSLAVHEAEPGSMIEILVQSSDAEDASIPGAHFVEVQLNVPGCNLPDPRMLERFEFPPSADAKSVNRMQVLAMCLATLRRVGGKIEVQANPPNSSRILLLLPAVN